MRKVRSERDDGEVLIREYEELKEKIRELRRGGEDVDYEELKLMEASLKINVFKMTHDKKEFDKVQRIFKEVKKSLGKRKK